MVTSSRILVLVIILYLVMWPYLIVKVDLTQGHTMLFVYMEPLFFHIHYLDWQGSCQGKMIRQQCCSIPPPHLAKIAGFSGDLAMNPVPIAGSPVTLWVGLAVTPSVFHILSVGESGKGLPDTFPLLVYNHCVYTSGRASVKEELLFYCFDNKTINLCFYMDLFKKWLHPMSD